MGIHTYYENQEENYNLDLDANCAISIEFYKWSKGLSTLTDLQLTCSEVNNTFWISVVCYLNKAVTEPEFVDSVISDLIKHPSDVLDEDVRDSFFGLLLREISVAHSTLELPKLFALSRRFQIWISDHFSEINKEKMNIDENASFDSTSGSIQPLPLPKVSQNSNRRIPVVSTIKFLSERVENAAIPGYLSTFHYLEKISANQTENNDDFINYLAALHFSDCFAVLDAFSAYFQNVIFNAELEKQREDSNQSTAVQSLSVRSLGLSLSVLMIYFGYNEAALKCLNQTQQLAHLNDDKEVIQQTLLWRVYLTGEQLPTFNMADLKGRVMPETIQLKQQLQLKTLERLATNNEPWSKIHDQMYLWLPEDSITSVVSLINCLMLKASIYEMYGFSVLAEMCAQQVLSVSLSDDNFARNRNFRSQKVT